MDRGLDAVEKCAKKLRKEDEGCKPFTILLPKDKLPYHEQDLAFAREKRSSLRDLRVEEKENRPDQAVLHSVQTDSSVHEMPTAQTVRAKVESTRKYGTA
jgi:hypothetical protein